MEGTNEKWEARKEERGGVQEDGYSQTDEHNRSSDRPSLSCSPGWSNVKYFDQVTPTNFYKNVENIYSEISGDRDGA